MRWHQFVIPTLGCDSIFRCPLVVNLYSRFRGSGDFGTKSSELYISFVHMSYFLEVYYILLNFYKDQLKRRLQNSNWNCL